MRSESSHRRPRQTREEWYTRPFIEVLNSSDSLGWEDVQLRYTQLYRALDYQDMPGSDHYSLIMIVKGAPRLKAQIVSESPFNELILPGAAHLITPQFEGVGMHDATSTTAFIELSSKLIPVLADGTFRGDPYHIHLSSMMNFHDTFLRLLIELLCTELNDTNPFGPLYAESIARTMMLYMMKTYAKLTLISNRRQHRFTTQQIQLIQEYLEEYLTEKISLKHLAGLFHISVSHFERIFRTTFGKPPYRYVIERRVESAKQLLSSPSSHHLSLLDVALMCGFANQSHMTRHFSRIVGVTPAHFAKYSRR